jgi:hypothetical protein
VLNTSDVIPRRHSARFVIAACATVCVALEACGSSSVPSTGAAGTSGSSGVVNPCSVLTTAQAEQLAGGAILTGSPESTDVNGGVVLDCFYSPADGDPNIAVRIDITHGVDQQTFERNAGAGQLGVHSISGIGAEAFAQQRQAPNAVNVFTGAIAVRVGTGQVSIAVTRRGGAVDLSLLERDVNTALVRLGSSFGTGTVAPSPTAPPLLGGPAQMTFAGEVAGSAAGKAQCSLTGGTYVMMATVQVSGQAFPTDVMVSYQGYTPGGSSTYQVGVDTKLVVNVAGADKWLTEKGGSVTIHGDATTGGGSIDAMLHDGGALHVTGTWSCAA